MTSQMLLLLLLQVCTSPVTSFTCDVTRAPTDQRGDRRTNDQEEAETTRAMRFGVLYRRGACSGAAASDWLGTKLSAWYSAAAVAGQRARWRHCSRSCWSGCGRDGRESGRAAEARPAAPSLNTDSIARRQLWLTSAFTDTTLAPTAVVDFILNCVRIDCTPYYSDVTSFCSPATELHVEHVHGSNGRIRSWKSFPNFANQSTMANTLKSIV